MNPPAVLRAGCASTMIASIRWGSAEFAGVKMVAREDEFKGHPTIILKESEDSQYGFTFGLSKAKLILAHIEEIQAFVDKNGGE